MDSTETYMEDLRNLLMTSLSNFIEILQNIDIYYQLLAAFVAIMLAFLVASKLRQKFSILQEPTVYLAPFSKRWFIKRAARLLYPFLSLLLLGLAEAILQQVTERVLVLNAIQRVTFVWFLWVIVHAFVTSALVRTVASWILLPAAFLQVFGLLESVINYLNSYGFKIGEINLTAYTVIKGIFFACIVLWIGKIVSKSGENYIRRSSAITGSTKELLIKLFDIALYALLFVITLNLAGIDLTALTVFGGALGVGLGFGLQTIASNFISGIILLSEKSININNLIEMDDGVLGYVRKLGARASVVETFDGKEVMVPNEDFITSRVANLTHSSTKGRIDIPVGVSYNADLHQVYDLILKAADSSDRVIHNDEDYGPKCFLLEYGDSSVNFMLTVWMEDVTQGRWRAKSDIMFAIWDSFKEHDIEIPFPQRDLHIRSGLDLFKQKGEQSPASAPVLSDPKESES